MGRIKKLLVAVFVLILFVTAIYVLIMLSKPRDVETSSSSLSEGANLDQSDSSFAPGKEVLNGNLDNIEEPADWKIYRDSESGFSLNVPQKVMGTDNCKNTWFQPLTAVLSDENTNAIFIVPEYYFDKYSANASDSGDGAEITFTEDDPVDEGDPNLSDSDNDGQMDCQKKAYNLALVKKEIIGSGRQVSKIPLLGDPKMGVALRIVKIEDTSELNSFISSVFGSGCFLSGKSDWPEQEGVYRLTISSSGKGACATDKVSHILYNPAKDRLAYALVGSKLRDDDSKSFEEEMIASFRFE